MDTLRIDLRQALAAALLIVVSQAASAKLLGIDFDGTLFDVSTSTGALTNARATGLNQAVGIAVRPSDNALFSLTTFAGLPADNSLFVVDATTGTSTFRGQTGLFGIAEGDLAFDPMSGLLYGIQDVAGMSKGNFFRLDTSSGKATVVGEIFFGEGDFSAMAFDASGNLFVLDTLGEYLLHVDKATGATVSRIPLNVHLGHVAGLSFDPSSGVAYVADGDGTNSLYTMDTATGGLTSIGSNTGLAGLAFTFPTNEVPEPAGLALFGMGLVGALTGCGRRPRLATQMVGPARVDPRSC